MITLLTYGNFNTANTLLSLYIDMLLLKVDKLVASDFM